MLVLLIASLVICVVGVLVARYAGSSDLPWIPRLAWIAALIVATFGIGQLGYGITYNVVQSDAVGGYRQFLNGSVISADVSSDICTEDGSCRFTFRCHPYQRYESYPSTDSKGNSVTKWHWVTHYHDCPYVTEEYSYSTLDSLGSRLDLGTTIGDHPKVWEDSPDYRSNLPRGVPVDWTRAHNALKSGKALPMTSVGTYDNYILASEDTLLKQSSKDIALLKKRKLLPEHTANLASPVHDSFDANKMSFVGFTSNDASSWQSALMNTDAALGMTLRGDLHIVAIKASSIPSNVTSEDYKNALKAYWLNDLGKDAFAKNGIMVILGVSDDGTTIDWTRASTGMPSGNGGMLRMIESSLTNVPFTPASVLGSTYASVSSGKPHYHIGNGLLSQAIFVQFPFKRACMKCTDAGEAASEGYVNVPTDAPVGPGPYALCIFLVTVLCGAGWAGFAYYAANRNGRY